MKPPPFTYRRPRTLDEAVSQLAESDGEAKVLAGGQSLVPLLNFRLLAPQVLVDINGLEDLDGVKPGERGLRIGALTRHRTVETSALVRERCPVLASAAAEVGHLAIRNRGTFGGSLAHNDPAAEFPLVAVLLDAEIQTASPSGERSLSASDFFVSYLATALEPDELIVSVEVPSLPAHTSWGFEEFSRRYGDFALAAAAATEAVAERARAHETTIVLPLYHADPNGRGTNVAVVIGPDGELVPGALPGGGRARWFTKVHLPASEAEGGILEPHHFSPGDGFPVFATPRAKLGILICYDRRFPEAGRTLALAGAEIILVPGCVPAWNPAVAASSGDMLVAELRTRAVENLVFVGACIRAGRETLRGRETRFVGRSCLIGPGGTLLNEAPMSSSCILRHTFGLGDIEKVRRRLPLLRDRRPELYFTGPEAGSR